MSQSKRPTNFTGVWTDHRGITEQIEQHYVNGVANGPHRSVLENGVVLREGSKQNGFWHGTLIVRRADGIILDVSEFVQGTGVYRIFNSKGQLSDQVPLLRGKPHGIVYCWRLGKLITTRYYHHGQCDAAVCEG